MQLFVLSIFKNFKAALTDYAVPYEMEHMPPTGVDKPYKPRLSITSYRTFA